MNRFRSALALVLLLSSMAARPARAQIDRVYPPGSEAHADGRWSLQFRVVDNFQLSSFSGAGLSVTKNTSPQGAWELGVSFGAQDATISEDRLDPTVPPLGFGRQDNASTFDFSLLRLHRYHPDRRIGLQFGVGPSAAYSHAHSEVDRPEPPLSVHSELDVTNYRFGVDAALGVEAFLATAISLHARYNAAVAYTHGTNSREDVTTDPTGPATVQSLSSTSHGWSLRNEGVTFGLSVYF